MSDLRLDCAHSNHNSNPRKITINFLTIPLGLKGFPSQNAFSLAW